MTGGWHDFIWAMPWGVLTTLRFQRERLPWQNVLAGVAIQDELKNSSCNFL
jgi:hypothetical protein